MEDWCREYVDPTDNEGRREVLLYQVDHTGSVHNTKFRVLDLSNCNTQISHTLNNEIQPASIPGSDSLLTDTLRITDDIMTLSFDIPFAAMKIYRDMYAFSKYGILADATDAWSRYSEGANPACQRTPERFYRLIWGPTFEEKLRIIGVGADKQEVQLGVYLFPKSVTWDWKSGTKDWVTVRFTGLVSQSPRTPANGSGTLDPLSLLLATLGFAVGGVPGYTATSVLATLFLEQIKAFVAGTRTTPTDPE